MKFFILLALCLGVSIGGYSQIRQDNKSIGSKAIVFLCDSTSSDVGLTVIDGIPYLHKPKQDVISLIDPATIKGVNVETLMTLDKDTYKWMERYTNLMKIGHFLSVTTVNGKGLNLK